MSLPRRELPLAAASAAANPEDSRRKPTPSVYLRAKAAPNPSGGKGSRGALAVPKRVKGVQCKGLNRKKKTRCANAALMEFVGPQPQYCAEHISQDPESLYTKCHSSYQTILGDNKGCKEIVLKEFGVCYKHVADLVDSLDVWHCAQSDLPPPMAAPSGSEIETKRFRALGGPGVSASSTPAIARISVDGGLEVAQGMLDRVCELIKQLMKEATEAKNTSVDLYQRKNKLIPKYQEIRRYTAYILDKYGVLDAQQAGRLLTERPSNTKRQRVRSEPSSSMSAAAWAAASAVTSAAALRSTSARNSSRARSSKVPKGRAGDSPSSSTPPLPDEDAPAPMHSFSTSMPMPPANLNTLAVPRRSWDSNKLLTSGTAPEPLLMPFSTVGMEFDEGISSSVPHALMGKLDIGDAHSLASSGSVGYSGGGSGGPGGSSGGAIFTVDEHGSSTLGERKLRSRPKLSHRSESTPSFLASQPFLFALAGQLPSGQIAPDFGAPGSDTGSVASGSSVGDNSVFFDQFETFGIAAPILRESSIQEEIKYNLRAGDSLPTRDFSAAELDAILGDFVNDP